MAKKFAKEIEFINANFDKIAVSNDKDLIEQCMQIWDKFFEEYVPEYGSADTVAGEIIRAYNHIIYRAINDGDIIGDFENSGYVESALAYVYQTLARYTSKGEVNNLHLVEQNWNDYLDLADEYEFNTYNEYYKFKQNFFNDHIRLLKIIAIELLAFLTNSDNRFLFDKENNDDYLNVTKSQIKNVLENEFELNKEEIMPRIDKHYAMVRELH